jgi:hypothetical protein
MGGLRTVAALTTRLLFVISALVWFAVGILVLTRAFDLGPVSSEIRSVLGTAMLAAAMTLAFLAWRVLTGSRLIDGLAVVVALVNVAVTLTDEVGGYDIAYLALSIVLLGSLLVALPASAQAGDSGGRRV